MSFKRILTGLITILYFFCGGKDILASQTNGLVQLWQVVPDGQQSKEGATTSQIMNQLKCRANHSLYPSNGSTKHETYINSCYVDDALYLGEDSNYFYIYLSGYEGKVPKTTTHTYSLDLNNDGEKVNYQIQTVAYFIPESPKAIYSPINEEENDVPILDYANQVLNKYSNSSDIEIYSTKYVQSPSYYASENGQLVHYLTNNVTVENNYSKIIVGVAPQFMKSGLKYYSYDGIYFYDNWQSIKVDGQGSINEKSPHYNYYQYLPFRSKTNYLSSTFDQYTLGNGGIGGKLERTGTYFYSVQDKYGINGALQYAMGIHESGWGKSSLSINKNNLFGMNATDNNPYGNGTSFPSVEAGINYHADRYLSWGYTDPISDFRYYGSHVGNKGSGMNVKYASDPYWGEKIAGWYYRFDKASGLKDYNYYTIGIKQSASVVDVMTKTNKLLYQTKNKKSNINLVNYPILVTGENGGILEIKTDTPIVNNTPKYSAQYIWKDTYGYVKKSAFYISNNTNYRNPSSITDKDLTLNNIKVDKVSPQEIGSTITITPEVSGGTGSLQYKYWIFADGKWTVVKDFSSATSYNWTPNKSGSYRIWVDVKDSSGKMVSKEISYTIKDKTLILSNIKVDKVSPQEAGSTIKITPEVSGGTGSLQYKYWIFVDGKWTVVKDFSSAASYNWTPNKAGSYRIWVDVKDSSGKMVSKEISYTIKDNTLTLSNIKVDKVSPQEAGSTIKITPEVSGGTGSLQYKYWIFVDGKWTVVKDFSSAASYNWTPNKAGSYRIWVDVKDSSGKMVSKEISYTIKDNTLTLSNIKVDKVSPQEVGSTIKIMPEVSGGTGNLQYQYWIFEDGKWKVIKGFSSATSYNWMPNKAGSYRIWVDVKDSSGKMVSKEISYTIKDNTLTLSNIKVDKVSPQEVGSTIKITPEVSGGTGSLQYKYWIFVDRKWTVVKDFSSATSYNWTPNKAGSYRIWVDVKDSSGKMVSKEIIYIVTDKNY